MAVNEELLKALRATRSDYNAEAIWMRFLLDAYSSGGGFTGKVKQPERGYLGWAAEVYAASNFGAVADSDTYLDRFDREDAEKFNRRKNVAHYSNYVAPILDLLVSYVLKQAPTREGLPEKVKEWQNDVDGKGTTWEAFLSDIVAPRAALLGWMPILIDSPKLPVGITDPTRAQTDELDIKPKAIALLPLNLLDWSCDSNGRFIWVKVRMDYSERPDPLTAPVNIEEYSIWYTDRVEKYKVVKIKDKEPVVEDPVEIEHSFGEVPIIIWRNKPSPEEPVRGISMAGDGAIANRRHFNLESELDEHIRSQVFGLLQVPVEDTQKPPAELIGGNKNALLIKSDARQSYEWIAPPESISETLEKRINVTVVEIYRMARVEYSTESGAQQSGISKAYTFEMTNRRLGDFAKQLARSETRTNRMVAVSYGVTGAALEDISTTAASDFRVEDLAADIDNVLKAMGLSIPPTAEFLLIERLLEKMLPNLPKSLQLEVEDELKKMRDASIAELAAEGAVNDAGEGEE